MRTPPRLVAAISAAIAGLALTGASAPAAAQSINLSTCSSWSIVGGVFTCTPTTNGGNNNGGNTTVAPSACTVNVSPSSGTSGTSTAVAVSVSCAGGSAPTSYSWSGGFMQGSSSSAGSGTVSATTNFSVTVGNSGGSAQASGTYTAQSSNGNGTGGGNTGGGTSCAGYNTAQLNAAWPAPGVTQRFLSNSVTTFGNNQILVVAFTVPANARAGFGRITAAEWGSSPTSKTAVLSDRPCDFTGTSLQTFYPVLTGVTVQANFSVGTTAYSYLGYPNLNPGQTYYFNIKNEVDGQSTCSNGSCDVFVDLKSP